MDYYAHLGAQAQQIERESHPNYLISPIAAMWNGHVAVVSARELTTKSDLMIDPHASEVTAGHIKMTFAREAIVSRRDLAGEDCSGMTYDHYARTVGVTQFPAPQSENKPTIENFCQQYSIEYPSAIKVISLEDRTSNDFSVGLGQRAREFLLYPRRIYYRRC